MRERTAVAYLRKRFARIDTVGRLRIVKAPAGRFGRSRGLSSTSRRGRFP